MTPPSWRRAPIAAPLPETPSPIRLGLGANWRQFTLLVVVNAFVGAMVGLERTVVPLIAQADFGLVSKTVVLSFLVSFGMVKALANLFAGQLADRIGRKPLLVAGWLAGLPVPLLIIWAPSWGWIVFANMLLGVNQGLCWSTTVIMKIDLVGAARLGDGAERVRGLRRRVAVGAAHRLPRRLVRPTAGAILSWHRIRHAGTTPLRVCRPRHPWPRARRGASAWLGAIPPRVRPRLPAHELAGPRAVRCEPSRNGQQSERWDGVGTDPCISRGARRHARPHRRGDRDLSPGVGNGPARHGRTERPLGTEVDDCERHVGAGGGHNGIRRRPLLLVLDGRRHALGDRDRAGLPHPTRGRIRRRAPRLAGERRGRVPIVAGLGLRYRRARRRAPGGRVHHALRNHGDRGADLRVGSGRGRSHVRDPARVSSLSPQLRTWNRVGDVTRFQKSTKPLDAVTPSKRPGCAFEILQLIVRVPALPSSYSTRRIASPAVLPGMLGTDASARSHRTSPVTL